jgi:hypothetical protein
MFACLVYGELPFECLIMLDRFLLDGELSLLFICVAGSFRSSTPSLGWEWHSTVLLLYSLFLLFFNFTECIGAL